MVSRMHSRTSEVSSSKLDANSPLLVNLLVRLRAKLQLSPRLNKVLTLPMLLMAFQIALSQLTDATISLPDLIRTSQTTKARLLHYFPMSEEDAAMAPKEDDPVDSWCGFHLDHSLLTGLCSVSPLPHYLFQTNYLLPGHLPPQGREW